jgi:hypothetical protein
LRKIIYLLLLILYYNCVYSQEIRFGLIPSLGIQQTIFTNQSKQNLLNNKSIGLVMNINNDESITSFSSTLSVEHFVNRYFVGKSTSVNYTQLLSKINIYSVFNLSDKYAVMTGLFFGKVIQNSMNIKTTTNQISILQLDKNLTEYLNINNPNDYNIGISLIINKKNISSKLKINSTFDYYLFKTFQKPLNITYYYNNMPERSLIINPKLVVLKISIQYNIEK